MFHNPLINAGACMVAEKGHPQPLEKAAAAIEMPLRQLQSRSGNGDAEAAIQMPLRQLKSRSGN